MSNLLPQQWWTLQRAQAAQMIADGQMTIRQIAKQVGVGPQTVSAWLKDARFKDRVQFNKAQTEVALVKDGIRSKENRLAIIEKQVNKIQALLETMDFDPKVSRELREYLKHAAIELGQWTEKKELTGEGGGAIKVIIEYSEQLTTQDDQDSDPEAP
jgi:transposase-like protein